MRTRALALLLLVSLTPLGARAQGAPPEGAWLRYRYEQRLSEGTGAYEGYEEATIARARYEIVSVDEAQASMRAQYAWTYSSPDRNDSGVEDRTVSFYLLDRRYTSFQSDVSDYDEQDATQLTTWIWISPRVRSGDRVSILEREFGVTSVGIPIEIAGESRRAISVLSQHTGRRDDAYGSFETTITDQYWYDADTGMFLREVQEERARGTLDGEPASFRMLTTVVVIDSSYAQAPQPPPEEDYGTPPTAPDFERPSSPGDAACGFGCCFLVIAGIVGIVIVVIRLSRRRRRGPTQTASGQRFAVEQLKDANDVAPPPELSASFASFLPHMMRVARAAGETVAVATTGAKSVLGVAIGDREAQVGTIFAPDSDVCEALRLAIGHSEFFSEQRHPALASVTRIGLSAPAEAYNVYETYEVMRLGERPSDLGYDTAVVRRYKEQDRAAVVALLQTVYGFPCERWLDASLSAGDLAWVACDADRIVGFAMATVVGDDARLHSLSVHPDQRARGLGTSLYRARLRALFDLGVDSVLTECATWNVAALELARAHGFVKTGVMYVESARSERDERKFVRR